jgi:hypothetical protein
MFLRQAEPQEVFYVAENMRERDFWEISALRYADDRKQVAYDLADKLANFQTVYVLGVDKPIVCLSYLPVRPGVWSLGMFATDEIKKVGLFLTKRIIRDIIPTLDRANAHRVEAYSIDGYEEIHNWLRFLGLKEECTLKKYGKNGEDFKVFSYVRQSEGNVAWRKSGEVS